MLPVPLLFKLLLACLPGMRVGKDTGKRGDCNEKSGKKWLLCGFLVLLAIYAAVMLYHTYKPLPKGISYEGKTYTVHDQDIRFLSDLTYREKGTGKRKVEQAVYPEIYRMIDQAINLSSRIYSFLMATMIKR